VTGEAQRFRVTHPFHPLFGREFEVLFFRRDWGDDRVSYRNESGSEASIPVSFTDLRVPDPFVVMAAGRCRFRFEDLIELTKLVEFLSGKSGEVCVNENKYNTVKGI
jgi:hypothetical protein